MTTAGPIRALLALGFLAAYGCSGGSEVSEAPRAAPSETSQADEPAKTIKTDEPAQIKTTKGSFSVPGKAFADGRDPEATPPLTIMRINVWDGVPRRQRKCQVAHAAPLELLSVRRDDGEGRYYFQIRSGSCEGWSPESFLSAKTEAPVGDRM